MGPGALRSGRTLARAPGLPPGSGRNRGAGGRGGVGGRDPRELRRGGEPGSKGEGEGGGAEETLLQHGVSSPRGGCKHGTRALFQGSPLKGQRLRRDLDSAAAFITAGAGAARLCWPGGGPGRVPAALQGASPLFLPPARGAEPLRLRGRTGTRPTVPDSRAPGARARPTRTEHPRRGVPEGGAAPPLHFASARD